MDIIDIKFCNDEVYELKKVSFTLEDVERQIRSINYNDIYDEYQNIKDEQGAEKENLPYLCHIFYHYIFANNAIPFPSELLNEYFKSYANVLVQQSDGSFTYKGKIYARCAIEARLLRTYPSLIRDFHFYLLLREAKAFQKITYSCNDDIAGKDIKILHNGREYVVSLLANTRRARLFKTIKNTFRHIYKEPEIEIRLDFKTAKSIGDIFVYDSSHVTSLIHKIKRK